MTTTIARPYAVAAFEVALAQRDLSGWQAMLESAVDVSQDVLAKQVLSSPQVTAEQRADLFCEVLKPLLNPEKKNFILLLAEYRRFSMLRDILTLFKAARATQEKTMNLDVTSTIELSERYQQKLIAALTKRLQRQVILHNKIDPTLIGGIMIRMGDTVIDGSIRGKLHRLMESI